MSNRRRPKKILSFDWDDRNLRVVLAHVGKRGAQIDRLLCVKIPPDVDVSDPSQMGRHIRRVLVEEDIATRHAVVDIPRDQAILNTLTLPCQASEELPAIVEIQVAKVLPFPVAEAIIDFAVSPSQPDATTADVLVAAVRHEVLKQYQETFLAAGLKLDRVGLRPYANKIAVCELLKHALPERVLVIDVRPRLTEISFLHKGFLAFARAAEVQVPQDLDAGTTLSIAPPPSSGLGEAAHPPISAVSTSAREKVVRSLLLEVTRSLEAYRAADAGASPDHVVIAGDTGVEEALSEALQGRLDVSTELYNPASTFAWEPDEGAEAAAFAAPLGLVIGHTQEGEQHFDFLHPKKMVSVAEARLKKAPLAAAVVVLFLAAGWVGLSQSTTDDRATLTAMGKKIDELKGNTTENRKFLAMVDAVQGFDADQNVWIDVLHDILKELPSNESLVIDGLDANQNESRVVLKTRATQRDTVSKAIRRLEAFRREGKEFQRFKVSPGGQSEKSGGKYPFVQELRIEVRDDERGVSKKKKSKRSRRR